MPDKLLTIQDVCARFHKGRTWMEAFLKDHPYYRLAGRKKLFTEADITHLWESMTCPSLSSPQTQSEPPTGQSEARSTDELFMRLQRRETKRVLADLRMNLRSGSPRTPTSKVVPLRSGKQRSST